MRRQDLRAGEEYVTSYHAHVRVVDLEPGWLLVAGQWHKDDRTAVRHKRGKDGITLQTYPQNPLLRCIVIDPDGNEKPGVVRPQLIVRTWAEHQKVMREQHRTMAVHKREARDVVRALKQGGLNDAVVDVEGGTVEVPISTMTRLLKEA